MGRDIMIAMAVVLCSSDGWAQPPGMQEPTGVLAAKPVRKKKIGTAYLLSGGITHGGALALGVLAAFSDDRELAPAGVAVFALSSAAVLLGPSAGHWYAGRIVTPGLVMRVGGVAAGVGAIALISDRAEGEDAMAPLILTVWAMGGAIIGGAAWDFATIPREVKRHNARVAPLQLGLVPLVTKEHARGLSIVGAF
jgi:hypothetical protein